MTTTPLGGPGAADLPATLQWTRRQDDELPSPSTPPLGPVERAVGVLGWVLLAASLAVLLAVGVHASHLGPDPGFMFDCNDFDQCEDLWADARGHYRIVTLFAGLGVIAGWLLAGVGLGDEATPGSTARGTTSVAPPRPRLDGPVLITGLVGGIVVALLMLMIQWMPGSGRHHPPGAADAIGLTVTFLAVALLVSAVTPWHAPGRLWLAAVLLMDLLAVPAILAAVGRSLNLAAAVVAVASVAVALAGRRFLLASGHGVQGAHARAGAVVVASAVGMGSAALALVVVLIFLWPLLFAAACVPALVHGLWFRSLRRLPEKGQTAAVARSVEYPRPSLEVLVSGVAAILLLALPAAWPVPALPADAARPHDPVVTPESSVTPEPTAPSSAPATIPQAAPTPSPIPVPAGVPACAPAQLALQTGGFDSAMGKTAAGITATNSGDAACALRGRPTLEIVQGGDPIDLNLVPMDERTMPLSADEAAAEDPTAGAILEPGGQASVALFWPGYRTTADQTTPQTVTVTLSPRSPRIPAPIAGGDSRGWDSGPAPFDLKDDVTGGAELRVGVWTPSS